MREILNDGIYHFRELVIETRTMCNLSETQQCPKFVTFYHNSIVIYSLKFYILVLIIICHQILYICLQMSLSLP